ncbi:MAG: autotransporter-associated beta strand repeat-containing protein [Opitutaceae bacterium]|jgi:autotransporter-associated beta strand protein|nr:autotransporter-associated beta strand repeat-containing protein [Opitutaceae bacterium]
MKNQNQKKPPIGLLLAVMLFSVSGVTAEDITWTGTANDGSWDTPSNWNPARAITNADTVIFNAGGTLAISMASVQTVGNLTFGAAATGSITIDLKGLRLNVGIADNTTGGGISVLAGHHEIIGANWNGGDIYFNGTGYQHLVLINWNIADGASLTLTNVHIRSNNNAAKIAKTGAGLMVLAGDSVGTTNAWGTGLLDIQAGTVRIAHAKATGNVTNNFQVRAGATLDLAAGYNSIDGTLTLNGTGLGGNGALYNSTGDNTIDEGAGTIALASTSTVGVADNTLLTIRQDISGNGGLVKNGGGTLHLAQTTTDSTFAGGTTVNAGTLRVSHDKALGDAAAAATINAGGTLQIDSGTTLANHLALAGGHVERSVAAGEMWTLGTTGRVTSAIAGGTAGGTETGAQILASQAASGTGKLDYAFAGSGTSAAGNDSLRASDVLAITGTGNDIYVLSLNVSGLGDGYQLVWLNAAGQWENAVAGNSLTAGASALASVAGSFAESGASATGAWLGTWGYDAANGTVWAILDHGGEFAVLSTAIPEPAAFALILGAVLGGGLVFSRKMRNG